MLDQRATELVAGRDDDFAWSSHLSIETSLTTSSVFSTFRRGSGPCSCCATSSAFTPREVAGVEISEASVNSLRRRSRSAAETRLPATGRERAPLPKSKLERDVVSRFADAIDTGDAGAVVAF